jgi:hypothetical protein
MGCVQRCTAPGVDTMPANRKQQHEAFVGELHGLQITVHP